jgi:ABC-type uncharacterized transport system substrate-binding protein
LADPGGNITGIAIPSGQLAVKQIELLREIVPTISRVAVLLDSQGTPGEPGQSD